METRPSWLLEAIALGQLICVLERQLDQLTYNYKNASGGVQKELSQLWLRKAQLERTRGEISLSEGA